MCDIYSASDKSGLCYGATLGRLETPNAIASRRTLAWSYVVLKSHIYLGSERAILIGEVRGWDGWDGCRWPLEF